jgi:pSer/pThr/pTyr-binding forkhead associated (FHA) protein
MEIQLTWTNPLNQEEQQFNVVLPVALGRDLEGMPSEIQGQPVSRIVLESEQISRFHILLSENEDQVLVSDRSTNGTYLNGQRFHQTTQPMASGDRLRVGSFNILLTWQSIRQVDATQVIALPSTLDTVIDAAIDTTDPNATNIYPGENISQEEQLAPSAVTLSTTIIFNPETDDPEPYQALEILPTIDPFPPPSLFSQPFVSLQALHATGKPVEEIDYVALGGGLGSFAWVDALRIYGVKPGRIAVLGLEKKPYGRYQKLCRNSQIPPHERIRSGSDSCPDNLWGWPGYALREAWSDLFSGQTGSAFSHLWKVFSEPAFADTYTPKAGRVFESLDREAERIGWERMLRHGRIRAIRKTEDGRYCIAYTVPTRQGIRDHRFLLARYVHLATGYPAVRFLPDLQKFRIETGDFQTVVNAYEEHEAIYQRLEQKGGTVVVRGRGIVASRIIQRLNEIHQRNARVNVVHLMRSPKKAGNHYGFARRAIRNQWEFQPYNWPKATWGGDMRKQLEAASPQARYKLLKAWGGTTTAERQDWQKIVQEGLQSGWYKIEFGEVDRVERSGAGKLLTYINSNNRDVQIKIEGDFIIDSTGLEAKPQDNPLLADLLNQYKVPLNPLGRLQVENDFELKEMRNGNGRMYAAGVLTLGGPYAAVDTFLGLQYCAQRSVYGLARARARGVRYLDGLGSCWQWVKWATNQEP